MRKLLSLSLALIMMLSVIPVHAIDQAGGTGTTPVELNVATPTFSVTVPTALPVNVGTDGTVTVSTNNTIENHSHGPVEVSSVRIVS